MSSNTSSETSNKMSTAAKSSSKKSTKTAEPVAVAAVAAPAPAKEVKAKATKAAKAETAAAPAPVAAPAPAPVADATPAVAPASAPAVAEEDVSAALTASIAQLHEQLAGLKTAFATAAATLKTIEKQATRVVKKAERRRKRKTDGAAGSESKKTCIFVKPVKISDELCAFLGKPKGTEISRSEVTKAVMAYAYSHNLMDKQQIKADASLRKLLTVTENDKVTILNLQKYLNRHYIKPAPMAA